MPLIWIGLGFAAFGLLVGTTCGLSSASLTTTLLGLLFALMGGSIGALLGKLDAEGRKFTGVAMFTFSICTTIGLHAGISVRINDLLRISPAVNAQSISQSADEGKAAPRDDYLKGSRAEIEESLKFDVIADRMTIGQACEELREQSDAGAAN